MSETNEQREARLSEELYQLKKLGAAGKLWSIEVVYNYDQETKRYLIKNQTSANLMKFREAVVAAGVMVPTRIEKGEYILVLPWQIITITVNKQSVFFES